MLFSAPFFVWNFCLPLLLLHCFLPLLPLIHTRQCRYAVHLIPNILYRVQHEHTGSLHIFIYVRTWHFQRHLWLLNHEQKHQFGESEIIDKNRLANHYNTIIVKHVSISGIELCYFVRDKCNVFVGHTVYSHIVCANEPFLWNLFRSRACGVYFLWSCDVFDLQSAPHRLMKNLWKCLLHSE